MMMIIVADQVVHGRLIRWPHTTGVHITGRSVYLSGYAERTDWFTTQWLDYRRKRPHNGDDRVNYGGQ